jgi:hypothetical protein
MGLALKGLLSKMVEALVFIFNVLENWTFKKYLGLDLQHAQIKCRSFCHIQHSFKILFSSVISPVFVLSFPVKRRHQRIIRYNSGPDQAKESTH